MYDRVVFPIFKYQLFVQMFKVFVSAEAIQNSTETNADLIFMANEIPPSLNENDLVRIKGEPWTAVGLVETCEKDCKEGYEDVNSSRSSELEEIERVNLRHVTRDEQKAYLIPKWDTLQDKRQQIRDKTNLYRENVTLLQSKLSKPNLASERIENITGLIEKNYQLIRSNNAYAADVEEEIHIIDEYVHDMDEHGNNYTIDKETKAWEQFEDFKEENAELLRLRKDYDLSFNPTQWSQRTDYGPEQIEETTGRFNLYFSTYFENHPNDYEQYRNGSRVDYNLQIEDTQKKQKEFAIKIAQTNDKFEFIQYCLEHFKYTQLEQVYATQRDVMESTQKLTGVVEIGLI